MTLKPHIPKFQDGEFLSEAELYQLAWLPLGLYRLNNQSKGYAGFFCPEINSGITWNQFEQNYNALTMHNLFVISPEGIPFVTTAPQRLELSGVTIDKTILFASVYLADSSEAFETEQFQTESGDNDIEAFEDFQNEPIAANAYQIVLHWGEDTAPTITGAKHFQLELGTLEGFHSEEFRPSPTAYFPSGLPELAEVTQSFESCIEDYIQLLLNPEIAPNIERSTLFDKLELLQHSLTTDFTPTAKIIADTQLMLRAAKGFYLRLVYAQNPRDPVYQSCKGLGGRMLEHRIVALFEGIRGALGEFISDLNNFTADTPETGYEQIEFFRDLAILFDTTRQTDLFASLNVAPTPPPQSPKQERQKTTPGPVIIDLNKDR